MDPSPPPPFSGGGPSEDDGADSELPLPRLTVTQVEQMKVEASVAGIYRILFGAAPNTKSVMARMVDMLVDLDRGNLYNFMLRVKDKSGAFRMHEGGEMDVRACYTAISVASLANILDDELAKGVGDYIKRCQTYEGGIAGETYAEAHGGYTFCGLAAMILLNKVEKLDLPSLIGWVAFRQGVECGFQGRTNKLVDGCYSFWQGAAIAVTQKLMTVVNEQIKSSWSSKRLSGDHACCTSSSGFASEKSSTVDYAKVGYTFINESNQIGPLFHNIALQQYILLCAQVMEGGLRDKPGKNRDHYHSCYCPSGLSVCQYSAMVDANSCPLTQHVLGPYSNLLEPIHPLYNVVLDKYHTAYDFFSKE